ncbi:MAG TPA: UPF0149 family protein [Rhodanobacteraceae bacterium]|nr:UPF0149 family protein [Rhodanobacteraceae bacterium]
MAASALTHGELDQALATLRSGVGASDLHGSLTGYLCAGGTAADGEWPAALALDLGEPERAGRDLAQRLARECSAQLDDPELGFEPLLPAADTPLSRRADALVEWCRGFLGGVGLAAVGATTAVPGDGAEVLRDFGDIAASHFETGEGEDDERAFSDVVEFVRIGVLLLHAELAQASRPRTLH